MTVKVTEITNYVLEEGGIRLFIDDEKSAILQVSKQGEIFSLAFSREEFKTLREIFGRYTEICLEENLRSIHESLRRIKEKK